MSFFLLSRDECSICVPFDGGVSYSRVKVCCVSCAMCGRHEAINVADA